MGQFQKRSMEPTGQPLLCFALHQEAKCFQVNGPWSTCITGMGSQAVEATLPAWVQRLKPSLLICAGLAGGLDRSLEVGQLVLDDPDCALPEPGLRQLLRLEGIQRGRVASSSTILIHAEEKTAMREDCGAMAVDMESSSIRAIAEKNSLKCVTIKAISDTANQSLPMDFNRYMNPSGEMVLSSVVMDLMRQPGSILPMIQFHRQVQKATSRLGAALQAWAAVHSGE
jgi:adenosylhomocysteine nucleosidase